MRLWRFEALTSRLLEVRSSRRVRPCGEGAQPCWREIPLFSLPSLLTWVFWHARNLGLRIGHWTAGLSSLKIAAACSSWTRGRCAASTAACSPGAPSPPAGARLHSVLSEKLNRQDPNFQERRHSAYAREGVPAPTGGLAPRPAGRAVRCEDRADRALSGAGAEPCDVGRGGAAGGLLHGRLGMPPCARPPTLTKALAGRAGHPDHGSQARRPARRRCVAALPPLRSCCSAPQAASWLF